MRWTLKQTILVRRMGRSILLLDLLEKTGHISHLVTMPCLQRFFFQKVIYINPIFRLPNTNSFSEKS